ncbi:MAG: hypothetical protein AB7O45_02775 [Alphaproteobacteria bacterium]
MSKTAQAPAEQPAASPPGPEMARVRDTLVKSGETRSHDLGGVLYTFKHNEHLDMPLALARSIAHIPEFEVLHPNGGRIIVDKSKPMRAAASVVAIRSDQVLASLDELTDAAVRVRAQAVGYRGSLDDVPAMRRVLMDAAAEAAERALETAGQQHRKLLVDGKIREVEFDARGRPILDDATDDIDRDVDYSIEDADLATIYAQQLRAGSQARRAA